MYFIVLSTIWSFNYFMLHYKALLNIIDILKIITSCLLSSINTLVYYLRMFNYVTLIFLVLIF